MLKKITYQTKRSQRYVICAPLHYRIRGERVWHSGVSHDMSDSGILFEGAAPLAPGTRCEMHVTVETAFGDRKRTSIWVHGTIVRSPQEGVWAARISGRRLRAVETGRSRKRAIAHGTQQPALVEQKTSTQRRYPGPRS